MFTLNKVVTAATVVLLVNQLAYGQGLVNAFTQDGKILVQLDNGSSRTIVAEGNNDVVAFSRDKKLVIYKKLIQKSKTGEEEGADSFDQYSFKKYDLTTNKATTLFTTCLDGNGGTKPSYANTSIYPNSNLCNVESAELTKGGNRLYFQTEGWATSPAVHYYNLQSNQLVFFKAGWLQEVTDNGVIVQVSAIEWKKDKGQTESKGRYTQTCLFDYNGTLIKELSKKEF